MLKLTGLLSVSMVREKVEYTILEQECVLWRNRMQVVCDRTSSPEEEYDNPKKQKETWEVGTMDEGEHPFPFEFGLPAKSMPSSIDVLSWLMREFLIIVRQRINYVHHSMYSPTTVLVLWHAW
jgi:hypothetical protein